MLINSCVKLRLFLSVYINIPEKLTKTDKVKMEYRKLGNSDLKLSVITFGAWAAGGWMWGGSDSSDAIKAIQAAFECGVTSVDTAPVYGQGASEKIVGEAIKGIPRTQVQILTKYGLRWDTNIGEYYFNSIDNNGKAIKVYKYAGKESIIKECEQSLRLLKTDYIDLYQIHWPDPTTAIQETMEAVDRLIASGKVRYAGVSNYDKDQLEEACKYVNIISDQVSYSMINRKIEQELIPYTMSNNKAILAYSPLGRGILTGKLKPGHRFARGDHRKNLPAYSNENIVRINQFLDKLQSMANAKGASIGQLVTRWTIDQPGITIALVGARNADQAVQNAKASDINLTEQELTFISDELDKLQLKE